MKLFPSIIIVLLFPLLVACSQESEQPAMRRPNMKTEVGYVSLKAQTVPQTVELRGRVVAYATAEVRPQVAGIVRKITFTEGRRVEKGDSLYEIDDAKFRAAYAAAEASLKKAQATTIGSQSSYNRYLKLSKDNAISQQDLDDANTDLLQARASEEAAKADLEAAGIDLDNATIKAPISGMIGVSDVSVGALVTENQTDAMTTIRQINPVHVDLADTSTNMLRMRDQINTGQLDRDHDQPMKVTLLLENGKNYDKNGQISLAEMVVNTSTGTFTLRATLPNPDLVLIPGMFVTATVDIGTMPTAYLVPQRALTRNDDGKATIYVVSQDSKSEIRTVTTSGMMGNSWIVSQGVKEGDRLIVDGFQKISDGSEVIPVAVVIDEDGVVKLAQSSGAASDVALDKGSK
ncbi:efflux RND transporter periplasmic adaptor subunit [Cohaesibacter celericrescens]|uniref:Efflux transporter periplasmic adaptor subunit n=1 Tax=Cohaesibacter celericrescens TaxID=2067669 RepID=A0A2N5XNL8_9HYPH|nr:efflux RND transporter periplasmic adaptor subunit [Cohaesibacter celericrescens]PLW76075.1 efflux transporter periplasmic adaptor subunit [Cohaesibacter celericrescens]